MMKNKTRKNLISLSLSGLAIIALIWAHCFPVADAKTHFIGGHVGASADPGAWSGWDEASESGLSTDQDNDSVEDTHIVFFENVNAGGNETGTGVVAGANLVWTQHNNVAGSAGTPPYREITAANEGFSVTDTLLDVLTGAEWTILLKLDNLLIQGAESYISYIRSGGKWWRSDREADGTLDVYINGVARTLGAPAINVPVYIATWRSAGLVRCGWTSAGSGANGQPTKWSDFNAANRFDDGATPSPAAGVWDHKIFFCSSAKTKGITAKAFYAIISSTSLIDNAL